MQQGMFPLRYVAYAAFVALFGLWVQAPHVAAEEPDVALTAQRIVETSGAAGGIAVVLGPSNADLALAIARQGPFVVHCLANSQEVADELRRQISTVGMYGTVSADVRRGQRLPYADNLVNIVVVVHPFASLAEVLRALAPLGTVHVPAGSDAEEWRERLRSVGAEVIANDDDRGWVHARARWPDSIDEWTHYLHGPDGNPVANDREVGPPASYQWVGGPTWQRSHESDSSISTIVTARGRLFYIVDEAPISLAGQHDLPDKWSLAAKDAFNGVTLWKVPIRRWGWREWKSSWFNTRPGDIPLNIQKRLVAVGDRVYVTLGYRAPVTEIDARTGAIFRSYSGTEGTSEILLVDGTLLLSVLSDGRARIMAIDATTGKRQWVTGKSYRGSTVDYIKWKEMHGGSKPAVLDPALNIASDGKVVAFIDGADVVCIDATSGAEKWRSAFPSDAADSRAGGIRSEGNLWVGTMIVSDGVVVHASPSRLAAFSAANGDVLWEQPKRYIQHLWYEWKDVFVIGGLVWTWSAELAKGRSLYPTSVNGYGIHSGRLEREVPLGTIFKTHHHHRCYRNKATTRYILASRRGTEFVDLAGGQHTVHNWVRGTCHVGMMPANGLHYAPPHPCQCYVDEKLNGMNALVAAPTTTRASTSESASDPLMRGPAFGRAPITGAVVERVATVADWPVFRSDATRSGSVDTRLGDGLSQRWRVRIGSRVSAPIAVGDRLYAAAIDEYRVVCLRAKDGGEVWSFTAGGRVDSPPSYWRSAVFFGSADGRIYCLNASDGALAWSFRAGPRERLIGSFGRLESAWPVHGSVLIEGDVLYAAAGRTSQLDGGIRLWALDPATGAVVHERTLSGPDYAQGGFDENYQLPMGALPDVLAIDAAGKKRRKRDDGLVIHMRGEAFGADLESRPQAPEPLLKARGGFLDGDYFKRMPWTVGGEFARMIVHDDRTAFYIRMFDTLRGLDPTVFFTPGHRGYLLFAKDIATADDDKKRRRGAKTAKKAKTWQKRVPIRVRAMVLADRRLVVAGAPDVVPDDDPLGSFEGRCGGVLRVFDADSGDEISKHELASPPVFNGAAAARGRLFLASEDGSVSCLSGR